MAERAEQLQQQTQLPMLHFYEQIVTFNQVPFDVDAARHYAELAVTARAAGRGFPTPDGYIAAIAASRGFIVASRDTAPYEAAKVTVINPWKV